ncbi:hypothetical protein L228DRAFT_254775 [Xylona heveae TC161]|uniref:Thioredoxin domain-containing protein n=1 Tax=Xylona heveae (strain CBS 132557 / TC161) TaxID=1328760 RepID=A0A165JG65_XYLHT|nr:hypothetical protein L228DRAFT_254775 [Xylona heveae TC161]KZF26194.1 hypothetical protein L228DRAFT_254775 [Xylona heveae TC161]
MSADQRPAPLRLGSTAPNFDADTTHGRINFHDFIGDKWVVLFSHPEDYTPVCTTELGAFAKLEPEFTKRGVKLIGLSANTIDSHSGWIKDINEISDVNLKFPIIGDKERKVAYLYDMLDYQDTTNVDEKGIAFTIRSVFIIDPKKTIRLILSYPASTGRNSAEVLRVIDSLQTGDKHRVTTPINWQPGEDVIVAPSVKDEEAKTLFPKFRSVKPYLRFTPLPQENSSAHTPSTNLSGLVCNVHRTTGNEPHSLVGATTTILGDKLYVFGGRRLSGRRAQMTSDLYELDLIKRHWTKIEASGDIPSPRYFHSVCALGDTKLVCYGGMSTPSIQQQQQQRSPGAAGPEEQPQPEVIVKSDVHIYDVPTRTWSAIATDGAPQGRYAHCACILPSSGTYTSADAPLSSMHHNVPSSNQPHSGTLGVSLDGAGGAEMVVVGGQDNANHYIEQVSVFNLRSLKWTATSPLGRSCGAYRSVVAPLPNMSAAQLGAGDASGAQSSEEIENPVQEGSPMLVYSNYNFLDVKLELQVRLPDGTLVEKPMQGSFSPPGLRFPNGGIINNHFIVSGTFLTSSKQEYALWVLDLATLTWSRIDAGSSIFNQGSWNRGVLWSRRNTYVILGNRRRNLVDDYHHRRINFSNICLVELEAFGLYDNPRKAGPLSRYISASSPGIPATIPERGGKTDWMNNGRPQSKAAVELGQMALSLREMADMDLVALGGERVPVNSRLIARRWGPYFNHLLYQAAVAQTMPIMENNNNTLHPQSHLSHPSRNSSITITPSIGGVSSYSAATTLAGGDEQPPGSMFCLNPRLSVFPPNPQSLPPWIRVRTLYLPHTHLTLQALVHYLYTSALPPPSSSLCTPQILCSILQLARPYQIDGLLEATVERLHQILNQRNAAAVFNAAAIAAGSGRGVGLGRSDNNVDNNEAPVSTSNTTTAGGTPSLGNNANSTAPDCEQRTPERRLARDRERRRRLGGTANHPSAGTDDDEPYIWQGEPSAVIGLHKRGLRGLMEGRRMRERGRSLGQASAPNNMVLPGGQQAPYGGGSNAPVSNGISPGGGLSATTAASSSSSYFPHPAQQAAPSQAHYQVFPSSSINQQSHSHVGGHPSASATAAPATNGNVPGQNSQHQHYYPSSSSAERIGLGIV